ncbi:hypothetical protein Q7P36_002850 [Cladosporium allicinum]
MVRMRSRAGNRAEKLSDDCAAACIEVARHKSRFALYNFDQGTKTFIVEKRGDLDLKHQDFLSELTDDKCLFAVYFFEDEAKGHTTFFITWVGDSAPIKLKLLFDREKDNVRRGVRTPLESRAIRAIDHEDLDLEMLGVYARK